MQREKRTEEDALQVYVDGAGAGLMGLAAFRDGEHVVDEVAAVGTGAGVEDDALRLRQFLRQ